MKTVVAVTCLLAAATVVRGIDQDTVIGKYMEYLMPDMQPCADEMHIGDAGLKNIQQTQTGTDLRQMGCMKACVMKRMEVLKGQDINLEPIYKMIEVVHAGSDADISFVKNIASECTAEIKGETDECDLGNKYTDCYIQKLFN